MRITVRHRTRGLAALGAVVLLLPGCTGAEIVESTGTVEGPIEYAYWGSPARADKVNRIIAAFEREHPGVTVTGEVADYTAYVERMTVRAAGGGLACLVGTQSTFVTRYAEQDVLRPLDDLIDSGEIDVSRIPPEVLAAGQIDGRQYVLPTGIFVRLLAYNTAMLDEAGVAAPTDDLTWDDYGRWLREVQAGLPDGVYATEIEAVNMFSLTSWVVSHGKEMFHDGELGFDRALLADWFRFWLDLTEHGATVPASSIPEQMGSLELTPLATGVAVSGTRDIPHLYITEQALVGAGKDTTIRAVDIPSPTRSRSANMLGVNGISMPTTCENVATAAAFANYFANDAGAILAFQSDNGIVANTDGQQALLADPRTPDGVKQNVTIMRGLTESGDTANTTYPAGLSTLTTELMRVYQDVAFERMSVDDAVDEFFSAAENALR